MYIAAKSLQSCLTLCDPIDGSPPGSAVPGIVQARTLEWVAISFSNARKWKMKVKSFSRVRLFMTPWTAAYQAPPPMGFSKQEYWSGLPYMYIRGWEINLIKTQGLSTLVKPLGVWWYKASWNILSKVEDTFLYIWSLLQPKKKNQTKPKNNLSTMPGSLFGFWK